MRHHSCTIPQLRRLVWVLSAPGAYRGALLLAPDAEAEARIAASLGEEDRGVLAEFGWQEGCGVRTMLNFQGMYMQSFMLVYTLISLRRAVDP